MRLSLFYPILDTETAARRGLAAAAVSVLLIRRGGSLFPAGAPAQTSFKRLTEQEGSETFPSVAPDGSNFVYVKLTAPGNLDIYAQRIGGSNPRNLTVDSPADDTQPSYSPDGGTIAFRSERDGGGIFLMGATGESVRRVTDFGRAAARSGSPSTHRAAAAAARSTSSTRRRARSSTRSRSARACRTSPRCRSAAAPPTSARWQASPRSTAPSWWVRS